MRISIVQSVFFIVFAITMIGTIMAGPATSQHNDDLESKNGKTCKSFCDYCGCTGFYCGEECICECNQDNDKADECIATVQSNAKKMKAEFEILIQGPSANQFVQDAQGYNQNQHCGHDKETREKRSTVVIYKPSVNALQVEVSKIQSKIEDLEKAIVKREVQLQQSEESDSRPKRQRPWFSRIGEDSLFSRSTAKFHEEDEEELLAKLTKEQAEKAAKKMHKATPKNKKSIAATPKESTPVKRSFLGGKGLNLRSSVLNNIFGVEQLPSCIFDAGFDLAADNFSNAVHVLKKAAEDLVSHVTSILKKKSDCFESVLSKKTIINRLTNLPGLDCLTKLFPKIRLCDLLEPTPIVPAAPVVPARKGLFYGGFGKKDTLIGDSHVGDAPQQIEDGPL